MGFESLEAIANKTLKPFTKRFGYDDDGKLIYVGLAEPGAATSEPKWQIRKLEYDANGNVIAELFAEGSGVFDKIWDNRATYTYR